MNRASIGVVAAFVLLGASCGDDFAGFGESSADSAGFGQNDERGVATGGAQPGGNPPPAGMAPLPPEVELSFDFELPQAGESYVYSASPQNDSVAVIDASTLAVESVEAGDEPTFLQTLQGQDAAVVLNVGSVDASIIRTSEGSSTTATVKIQAGTNAIAVSPTGQHAVVYFDDAHRSAGVTGSYQDVSVLFLEEGEESAVNMTIGFRPSRVSFADDGSQAYVVTDDGVSVLNFEDIEEQGSHIARTVALGDDANVSLDVSVTSNGRYALARREGDSQLRLVDLESEDIYLLDLADYIDPIAVETDAGTTFLPVAAAVTDVDLAPSGDFALAVIRDQSSVLQLPIPGAFTDDEEADLMQIDDELVGSVSISPDSQRALLYTTAIDTNERLTILDLDSGEFEVVRIAKAVERVSIAPNGETALIVHKKLPGSPDEPGIDADAVIDRSFGYSVVNLETGFTKLQTTRAAVGPSAVIPDSAALFVLFNSSEPPVQEVHHIDLNSFVIERIGLGSPPQSVGVVPGSNKVFVGQEHQDGRIAFIDWETGEIESVTGFDLNSRIRE